MQRISRMLPDYKALGMCLRRSVVCGAILLMCSGMSFAQFEFERAPISYSKSPDNNRVTRLMADLQQSDAPLTLTWDAKHGYLRSLLKLLKVSPASQTLVFSKTSLQQHRITPETPRAIYFNDDVYVGWVPHGDVIEISAADPQLGGVFYTLSQDESDAPIFKRENSRCLQCHASTHTRRIPGHIVRSVYSGEDGLPIFRAGTFRSLDASPISERFGGWYVTGTSGSQHHMGNQTVANPDDALQLNRAAGSNRTNVRDLFQSQHYLTPHSDLVALMVLVHQVTVHNALTTANHSARLALHDGAVMNKALERPPDYMSDSTKRRLSSAAEKVVDALLLAGSQDFRAPLSGTSEFARTFAAQAGTPNQRLRQLNLQTRLFEFPCSYLLYSEAFAALPEPVRRRVRERLRQVLSADSLDEKRFAHLPTALRKSTLRVLKEQKFFPDPD